MRTRSLLLAVFIGFSLPDEPCGHRFSGTLETSSVSDPAFLEVRAQRSAYYPGEVVSIEVRFGFERAHFEELVPLFRRELDLSLQVNAPWAEGGACAIPLPQLALTEASGGVPFTFVLNEEVKRAIQAEEQRAGASFVVFSAALPFRATCTGEVQLPNTTLRYAHSGERQVDPFGREVTVSREVTTVVAEHSSFSILPFPEAGRPPDFRGAAGRFRLERTAVLGGPEARDRMELTLKIEGTGTVLSDHGPHLSDLPGIHVLASSSTPLAPPLVGRVYTYELERELHVRALPAFRFVYFDTGPEPGYRSLSSEAMPWPRPASGKEVTTAQEGPSSPPPPAEDESTQFSPHYLWAVLPLALIVLLARKRPAAPAIDHGLEDAVAQYRGALMDGVPTGPCLDELFTRILGSTPALLSPPELGAALDSRGISPQAVQLATTLHEAAHSAAYGRSDQGPDRDEALRLAELLMP